MDMLYIGFLHTNGETYVQRYYRPFDLTVMDSSSYVVRRTEPFKSKAITEALMKAKELLNEVFH